MPHLLSFQNAVTRFVEMFRLDSAEFGRRLTQVVVIWLLGWLALRLVRLAAARIEARVDDGDPSITTLREKRGKTLAQLLRTVGRGLVLVAAALLTLNLFVEIGPLLAGAGILGLAVSFGAQSLVKDFISGFFFLLENQFALGDVIEAAGKSGVVEQITLRVVVLRDIEGTRHVIPNGNITVVSNKTAGWGRAIIDVPVGGSEDVDRVLAAVREEAQSLSRDEEWRPSLDGVPDVWGVEALGDNRVVVRAVARTQPGAQWGVGRELRRRFKNRFDAEGIRLPGVPAVTVVPAEHPAPATGAPAGAAP
ncbi:MAG TPA: mechanosensitive ion channel family protein [Gemmatimonadales bacterium]|nr:mechanosensitive ion channel family protein [Gemmatimonadales bacterium]